MNLINRRKKKAGASGELDGGNTPAVSRSGQAEGNAQGGEGEDGVVIEGVAPVGLISTPFAS